MIYTFYSYKGGVGRSMAMANVGELFSQAGLNVLLVDWDLEAPGLERFFALENEKTAAQPGVIDMLSDYKRQRKQEQQLKLDTYSSSHLLILLLAYAPTRPMVIN